MVYPLGGVVPSWLVCLTLDQTVWVWALAGDIVLWRFLGKTLNSHSASVHLGVLVNGYGGKFNADGNPVAYFI